VGHNKVKYFIIALLITILLLAPTIYFLTDKPNIHDATIEELQEINDIGEVLSFEIVSYLNLNKNATVQDLMNIDGIGPVRIEKLKKEYGD